MSECTALLGQRKGQVVGANDIEDTLAWIVYGMSSDDIKTEMDAVQQGVRYSTENSVQHRVIYLHHDVNILYQLTLEAGPRPFQP